MGGDEGGGFVLGGDEEGVGDGVVEEVGGGNGMGVLPGGAVVGEVAGVAGRRGVAIP